MTGAKETCRPEMAAKTGIVREDLMHKEQDKKQEVKEEPSKAEEAKQELSDEDLDDLSGGIEMPYLV